MKKLLLGFMGFVGLIALTTLTSGFTHKTEWFLEGTNVIITSFTTNNWGDTNVPYTRYPGTQTFLLPAGGTNAVVLGPAAPNTFSLTQTNVYLYASSNGTIVTNYTVVNTNAPVSPIAWHDVGIWPDGQGDAAPLELVASFNITNAAQSNIVTIVLQPMDGGFASPAAQWVTSIALNPAVVGSYTFITNLPSTLVNGNAGIRLKTVGLSASSQTNLIIQNIGIAGWAP